MCSKGKRGRKQRIRERRSEVVDFILGSDDCIKFILVPVSDHHKVLRRLIKRNCIRIRPKASNSKRQQSWVTKCLELLSVMENPTLNALKRRSPSFPSRKGQ
ncbi:hypothetical protein L2E82_38030 [Cichorium intybus]|uniref:Uncharacterized protein n=1 Tax=Cichorium intybus TaxID=13427 RepID=A0ACB9AG48_CICIN|nr:hypothetical protein L2E82_38030 [Cichorium intybus]